MPSWILIEHFPLVWNCLISWFVLSKCLLAHGFWFPFHRCILVALFYYSLLHSPNNAAGLFSGLSVLVLCSGCPCQITKCAPVMNTGMRFFRYNILLPSAFFLSNWSPSHVWHLNWLCPLILWSGLMPSITPREMFFLAYMLLSFLKVALSGVCSWATTH